MQLSSQNDNNQELIQKFVQLVFEESADYSLLLSITKSVGINSVFPCSILYRSNDGTEIKKCDYGNNTFLFIALFYMNEDVIRLLLENGADPNVRGDFGEPPIWGLQYEHDDPEYGLRVTRLLLEHGADPNIEYDSSEGFYTYVDTKPADVIESMEECNYLKDLSELLEEFGGRHDWEE